MKRLTIFCCLFLSIAVFAQKDFEVPDFDILETEEDMSKGFQPGLSVFVSGSSTKDAEKEWKKWMKSTKAKVTNSRGEMSAIGSSLLTIYRNKVDVYAQFNKQEDGVVVDVFFDLGDQFINSTETPEEYEKAEKYLQDFGVRLVELQIEEELGAAKKDLKNLNNKQKKLEKENDNLHDDIKKYEEAIRKAKKEIEENLKNQEETKNEIELQDEQVKYIESKLDKFK